MNLLSRYYFDKFYNYKNKNKIKIKKTITVVSHKIYKIL